MITPRQRLLWWIDNLGWPGVMGIVLAIVSVVTYTILVIPGQADVAQLDQELNDEHQAAQRRVAEGGHAEQSSRHNIDMLSRDFPSQQEIAKQLSTLYAAANNSNLVLQRGVYKLVHDTTSPFPRYEIDLPVQGRYPEIQLFAYQALKDVPALALEDISFKRESANATVVQAKLHFTLYLRDKS